ncbi:cation efflux system protein CusF precursor [mine drainage metagenome]|uniref:Cation efflux system protein CusF n=1 Tax=mine drainage metagenome TaxID=410659 RepID=A0A1J5SVD8_9ZZZZ|nr:copper-binding protein [Methylotenera sp.]MDP1958629.1 copper-binding protein [Methylotenera sp.]
MKRFLIMTLACITFGGSAIPVYANDAHHPKADVQKSYAVKGEVVVVDKATGKVKLKHEPVPELDWPAMTMFFAVADKSQLDVLKAGDQVKFEFIRKEGGAPLITQINTVK